MAPTRVEETPRSTRFRWWLKVNADGGWILAASLVTMPPVDPRLQVAA
jgi:hypothetical protein